MSEIPSSHLGRRPPAPPLAPAQRLRVDPPPLPGPPPLPAAHARSVDGGGLPPILSRESAGAVAAASSVNIAKHPLLDVKELERFKNIVLFAESTVEGFFSGRHRSPKFGSSAEFADYKEYVQGDAVAKIDWRVYGRSRRLYVRQFHEETDMVVYLVVDVSGSMAYEARGHRSKYQHAARVAAALAYLILRQGDKAALALFSESLLTLLPAGGTRAHLFRMLNALEKRMPDDVTAPARAFEELAGAIRKRGRMIVISDMLCPLKPAFDVLSRFVHRGFEVLLLQVLDPHERELPDVALARFVDLETGESLGVEPEEIRVQYRKQMDQLVREVEEECSARRMGYKLINPRHSPIEAIESYLGFRERAVSSKAR